jgi:hypothetical protein
VWMLHCLLSVGKGHLLYPIYDILGIW